MGAGEEDLGIFRPRLLVQPLLTLHLRRVWCLQVLRPSRVLCVRGNVSSESLTFYLPCAHPLPLHQLPAPERGASVCGHVDVSLKLCSTRYLCNGRPCLPLHLLVLLLLAPRSLPPPRNCSFSNYFLIFYEFHLEQVCAREFTLLFASQKEGFALFSLIGEFISSDCHRSYF